MKVVHGVLLSSDDALQQYLLHQKQFNPQLFGPNASDEILTSNKMFVANPSENLPIILQNGIDTWLDTYAYDAADDADEFEP